jgi:hypothetical protein
MTASKGNTISDRGESRNFLAEIADEIGEELINNPQLKASMIGHIKKVIQEAEKYGQYLRDEWKRAKETGLTQYDESKDENKWYWWTAYVKDGMPEQCVYFDNDECMNVQFYMEGKPKPDPLSYLYSMIYSCIGEDYGELELLDYQIVLLSIIHDAQSWQAGRTRIYFNVLKKKTLSDRLCQAVWHKLESRQHKYYFSEVKQTITTALQTIKISVEKETKNGGDITTPEQKKQRSGLSKKTIVIYAVCTLVIAILGLLFGDNILGRFKEKLENNDSIININGNELKKEATEKKAKGIRAKMSYNISEEFKRLIKEQINPWGLFNSGRGSVKKFDGKTIPFSGGFTNSSIRIVFWKGYIEPYIEDIIKRMIEGTVELANNKNVSISMVLGSTEANLSGGIDTVYYEMQKVDRRLRGGGDPESVLKKDVSFEVKKMNDFLDRQIKIAEDLHFKIQETGEAGKDRKEERGRS